MKLYVLGQMQNPVVLPKLTEVLKNELEHVMVRHEAAEAMGAIGDESIKPILEEYSSHPLPEIAESCQVAIDLLNWVKAKSGMILDDSQIQRYSLQEPRRGYAT